MSFEIHAKALILFDHQGKILLLKERGKYLLPGSKVELGETAEKTLRKYLKETLSFAPLDLYFMGIHENIKSEGDTTKHEYDLIFKVDGHDFQIPEKNFEWAILPLQRGIEFEPDYLKEDLSRWLKGKEIFLSTKDKAFSA